MIPDEERSSPERLQRRLDRERRARQEAEAIAERGLRELYEGQQLLRLVEAIATATNRAESLEDTFAFALTQVCRFMAWPTGHAYWVSEDGEGLVSTGLWSEGAGEALAEFRRETRAMPLRRGVGLPGRVLDTGQPVWVADVAQDDNFPRRTSAARCRLHAGVAFPVLVGRETAAVLEFFCEEVVQPNEATLSAMGQIGAILGRAVERKRAEERLLVKVAEAEAANRAKSDFLAVASHEVRTPLNAVLGLAQALKREPLSPRQDELVGGVLEAGAMLLRLLNALLDLSKIEAGKMTLDLEPFDLAETARRVVRVWSARAAELRLDLELDLAGLPAPCPLMSDPGKVEQTLVNLISNAAKFSPPGGKVSVRALSGPAEAGRRRVRIEVGDQGPGVEDGDRQRIFGAFEQTPLGRQAGGAGLGLSICAGNVALLGGRIGVDPSPGGGACFWFEFLADIAQAGGWPDTAEVDTADDALGLAPLRVLAAEDNPANRLVLEALLSPVEGLELVFAQNGAEALEAFATRTFDLVLMDANMPVMDGVTALKAIRAMPGPAGAAPVFMVTANVFPEDVGRYQMAGADGVLRKPIDIAELYGVVAAAAKTASPQPALKAAV